MKSEIAGTLVEWDENKNQQNIPAFVSQSLSMNAIHGTSSIRKLLITICVWIFPL
jgi:LytS/YehU family sensor histidine kinase